MRRRPGVFFSSGVEFRVEQALPLTTISVAAATSSVGRRGVVTLDESGLAAPLGLS